ncbi:MAG TPA: cytidylate kinase-like family protein [Bryobacteraceae bacterium]|nr:cytidylate kinase-like family protein [Bryobacteraceae bacterium]
MSVRVITVGGEYGSGRAPIARAAALALGWNLVDRSLIESISRAAHVDCETASHYDECIDSWFHRLRKALWHGGYEGVATSTEAGFDADAMATLAHRVIEEAANQGNCVIVGRGGQCILQGRHDAFHVFVYAPRRERIERVLEEHGPIAQPEELMDTWDRKREAYIRRHFGHEWTNPHLYDLMLCSSMGEAAAVAAILAAVGPQVP